MDSAHGVVLRAFGVVALGGWVSRLTGLVRTMVLASALGFGRVGDAYNTANALPTILYQLLLGGMITTIVVPMLVHARDPRLLGQRLLSLVTLGMIVITALAVWAAPGLVWLCGIHEAGQAELTVGLTRILLVELVFYGVGGMLGAILNSRDVFAAPAWAPVANNIVVIGIGLAFIAGGGEQVWWLALGTAAGIAAQAAVLVPAMRRIGWEWRWRLGWTGAQAGEVGRLGLWALLDSAATQVGFLIIMGLANSAGAVSGIGSSVYLSASMLLETPYAVVGAAVLTALLPRMSRSAAAGDRGGLLREWRLGNRLAWVTLGPIAVLLALLSQPIATLAFGRGRVSPEQAHAVGVVLALCAFSLVPIALAALARQAFYAAKDARTPTLLNIVVLAVRIPLCVVCSWVLPPEQVVAGLGVCIGLSYVAGSILGNWCVRNRIKWTSVAY